MKQLTLVCILFFFYRTVFMAQQATVSGVVSIHNSQFETGTRQYVAFAQVEDEFEQAQAQLTDANGQFRLIFVKVNEKTTVRLQIKKEGLIVVNTDDLAAVAGQIDQVGISMATPERIADYRRQIYNVGKTSAEKNLEVKLSQLKKERTQLITHEKANQERINELEVQIAQFEEERMNIDQTAKALARKYALLNLDDTAPVYQEAFRYFQNGSLDTALMLLQGANYEVQVQKILTERERIAALDSIQRRRTQDAMEGILLKKDLHFNRFEFDSVRVAYEMLLQLDSNSIDLLQEYGQFLASQHQPRQALSYLLKALEKNDDPQKEGTLYNGIGNQYRLLGDNQAAGTAYEAAIAVFTPLAEADQAIYAPYLALSLNNFGNYQRSVYNHYDATSSFALATEIYEALSQKESEKYQPYLAMTYNNLGRAYYENMSMVKALSAFEKALDLYEMLVKQNPDAIVPTDLQAFIDLNLSYNDNDKLTHSFDKISKRLLERALAVHRQLADRNPAQFMPFVALTLNNLGRIYNKQRDPEKAEKTFVEALSLLRELAEKNPRTYSPFVALTLRNLVEFYSNSKRREEADRARAEAEAIEMKYGKL